MPKAIDLDLIDPIELPGAADDPLGRAQRAEWQRIERQVARRNATYRLAGCPKEFGWEGYETVARRRLESELGHSLTDEEFEAMIQTEIAMGE